jgi:uncharacterized protein (TIGR03085 family)
MATPLDARERVQLCARFEELGPDAPTLCEGWTTFDLAAHLVVRERNPLSGPGIVLGDRIKPAADLTERLMAREKRKGYARVVERVRNGPPLGPFRVPGLRERINLVEYAVHHEDVRRANDLLVRDGIDDLQEALWGNLKNLARLALRGVEDVEVTLARPAGGASARVRKGGKAATMTGDPLELLLFLYGRGDHAHVDLAGDDDAVEALQAARLGI